MLGVGVYQHHDDNKVTPSTGDHSGTEITVINLWIILLIGCLFISQDEKRCVSNNFGNRFGTWSLQFLFIDVDFFFNLTGKHFIYVYYSYMEYLCAVIITSLVVIYLLKEKSCWCGFCGFKF